MNILNILKKYFLISFFLLFLTILGAISYLNLINSDNTKTFDTSKLSLFEKDSILKEKHNYLESSFNENFAGKLFFVEKYGALQKLFGKKLVDDSLAERRVYKGNNDMLYYIIPQKNINEKAVKNIAYVKTELEKSQIPTAFIMPPNKHSINSENFPYGVLDYATTNSDELYQTLMENGITTLNLNSDYFKEQMDDTRYFYMTDTHWKNETAFWAYQKTLEFLKNTLSYDYYNKNNSNLLTNYSVQKTENTYIGSMGKRVGKDYIVKKDDYELIIPAFETNYSYKKYDENFALLGEKMGNFEKVFVNKEILESKDIYIDKYTTMMGYGSPYEIITNENIDNNSKIAIIKDSFAMPFSAYLSTNIAQIHLLDTRYENIRKNLLSTIKTLKPDYVLFICSPSSVYYFPDMFEFGAK
ncbi:hypothetical protein HMPREF9630_02029 [Peptoanaerobacter stomatis]|uniref:AlgX/AlgJ SGNH hydrolase-like domain-containing protein n=1 Tax=Peptoanaerobacter stomatis TaxID=796937 RepID=V9HJZ8_9FIRM|nr:hypothetical protein [Peptoanaerobacter stomatis]EHL15677.1 hypothetical protein HMPREF9630_02029 [Peptoanaerobacter stomatis]